MRHVADVQLTHILEAQQFDRDFLANLFLLADAVHRNPQQCMANKILGSLFYEPSTRTRLSFDSAMTRLGGRVIGTENAREFSSAVKGETLEDTIRVVAGYVDVIVLRHDEDDAAKRAAKISDVPIINAGCGKGQHPTQALLDLYTIKRRCGTLNGISIALVGDLANGRTARSLAYLLSKYEGTSIFFVSPEELRVGEDIKIYLDEVGVQYEELQEMTAIVGDVDVIYMTRVQKERFADPTMYERLKDTYRMDCILAGRMRKDAIIMHPLPRNNEIDPAVDVLPQAAYFEQARNGLPIRMALLQTIFTRK